jgi:hypothetical protein
MKFLLLPLAILTIAMSGCAAYDNEAMAGAAVDIPNPQPIPPIFSGPSPTPAPNPQQLPAQ